MLASKLKMPGAAKKSKAPMSEESDEEMDFLEEDMSSEEDLGEEEESEINPLEEMSDDALLAEVKARGLSLKELQEEGESEEEELDYEEEEEDEEMGFTKAVEATPITGSN